MRRVAVIAGLGVLSFLINGLGLILLVHMNKFVMPKKTGLVAAAHEIDFRPPPRKQQPRRIQRQQRSLKPRPREALPPNLPSAIQSPGLLDMDLDVAGVIRPVFDDALKGGADLVMTEDTVDEPPRVLHRVPPRYPQDAADEGIEGFVQFRLLVNKSGLVEKAQIERSRPEGVFDEAGRRAVVRWRFAPAVFQGKPVSVWVRQRMVFKLDDKGL